MTGIISAISGQFSKSLILGTFLPAFLFVVLGVVLAVPLFPESWTVFKTLESLDPQWKVVAISFAAVVLTGLLYNLNIPIMQLYEGYPWRHSWWGRRRTKHYQSQFDKHTSRWVGMTKLREEMEKTDPARSVISKQRAEHLQILNASFPRDRDLVLPTRLGNVIRSFEDYSYRQYGMESITLWPRLIAKIDKDYAVAIDETKASFDFVMNCSMLSALMALIILISGLVYPLLLTSWSSVGLWLPWVIEIAVSAGVAYWFYVLSLSRASAWGEVVKSAFDLYRWDLLKHLGYQRMPVTMAEERAIWNDVYQQMLYGDSPHTPMGDYKSASSFAMPAVKRGVIPDLIYLRVARGVSLAVPTGRILVTLTVKNVDPRKRKAEDIIVTDNLAEGFEYDWDSAYIVNDPRPVEVEGTNPYQFRVGDLVHDRTLILRYRANLISSKK
ncbi:MAG: hypothetical protein QOK48_646 [Blastocatellia bacterium]|jgi:hypothetical protein|nr:hypothetical protein [Blastocatellia bacterium]